LWKAGMVGLVLMLMLSGAARARAADGEGSADPPKKAKKARVYESSEAAPVRTSAERRLDELSGDVGNLRKSETETNAAVEEVRKAIVIKTPEANATPTTIGEHVGVLERDLADTRKNLSDNLGIIVHGLVDASYEHNFNQPTANVNLTRAWDENGFQLTQGNLHIEKDGTVGFVSDLNVGQVANSISSATHYSNFTPGNGPAGQWFDPTQYYLTYTAPIGSGLALQAGRFVTLEGEEVVPTYSNQNYNETRGLLFTLGEPLTHTGIRGAYTVNDYVSLTGGLNNGWDDPAANNNGGPTFEYEATVNTKDKSLVLTLNGTVGSQALQKSNQTLTSFDPIVTWKPWFVPNTTLVAEYLYASQDGPAVFPGHSATWQGGAGYAVYDWNQWEFATRGEFFDDEDGFRTGLTQTLWEITQTVTYKVPEAPGLLLRGEYRHDNSNQNYFTNNNFIDPVTGVQDRLWRGQDTLTGSMIYAF
jgi:hypothetical protein